MMKKKQFFKMCIRDRCTGIPNIVVAFPAVIIVLKSGYTNVSAIAIEKAGLDLSLIHI